MMKRLLVSFLVFFSYSISFDVHAQDRHDYIFNECSRLASLGEEGRDLVRFNIIYDLSVDFRDSLGKTSLLRCAENPGLAIKNDSIKFLLGLGADINAVDNLGNGALDLVISSGEKEEIIVTVVKALLRYGAEVKDRHILLASDKGQAGILEVLLEYKRLRSVQKEPLLDIAIGTKNRTESLKRVLFNLNSMSNAKEFAIFIMDGNEGDLVSEFINSYNWNFSNVVLYKDNEVEALRSNPGKWAIIYNFLLKNGGSPYITYWSDDIFLPNIDGIEKSIHYLNSSSSNVSTCLFPHCGSSYKTIFRHTGYGGFLIEFGIIKREFFEKCGGLDERYDFFFADTDLSNNLYLLQNSKFILSGKAKVYSKKNVWQSSLKHSCGVDESKFFDKWHDFHMATKINDHTFLI